MYHELLKNFVIALSKLVREEEAIYGQISDEEWEAIRLNKRERRDSMLEHIKVSPLVHSMNSVFKLFLYWFTRTPFFSIQKNLREQQICTACVKVILLMKIRFHCTFLIS